jgi:hypothetical protein
MRTRLRARRGRSLRSTDLPGSFWPSHAQELLLEVALGPRESDARSAWEALRRRLDLDNLEEGSYALLPLVNRRLREFKISDGLLPRLGGIQRKTWITNHASISTLKRGLLALSAANVESMVVNEASIALRIYPDMSLRPLTDIEIVVPVTDSATAAGALEKAGWYSQTRDSPEVAIASNGGLRFETPDRSSTLALRIHPVAGAAIVGFPRAEAATRNLWECAVVIDVDGIRTHAPGPAAELFYTCISGVRGRSWKSIQWIADATMIIRGEEVDWEHVVAAARQQGLVLPLRDAFTYLMRLVDAPIPLLCRRGLALAPVIRRESVAYFIGARGGRVLGDFPSLIAQYIRMSETTRSTRVVAGAPRFVKRAWGLSRWSDAPELVAGLLARRLRAGRRRGTHRTVARGHTS